MIDWRHWHNEPYLVGGLVLLGWLYALLTGPLRLWLQPGAPFPRAHALRFYSGLVIFYLAVGSPLDQIGERFLLSAHMLQHQLIIYPAAALFLTGLPPWLVAPLTVSSSRRRLLGFLSHPLICGAIYTLVISTWHIPVLYEWALQDKLVHVIEHLSFFIAALFFWQPIFSPFPALPPRGYGVQMIYLVGVIIAMTPVFAFIAFSENVLYPTYEYAPRLIPHVTPQEDQLLGAAIMQLGGALVTFMVFGLAFYRWHQKNEQPT